MDLKDLETLSCNSLSIFYIRFIGNSLNPNNIRDGLKHAAKKNAEIAVLYFENGFSKSAFESGLAKYEGLKNDPRQDKDLDEIICIEKDKIVYKKSHR